MIMTDFDIHKFFHSYVAALNAREFDHMDQFVADEVTLNNQPGTRDAVVAALKSTVDAVPDFRWVVQEFLVDGDRAAVRAVNTGIPVKEWLGVSPTGASFKIVEYAIYRIQDGRFVEMTYLHDSEDAKRQLNAA
jgi:predicted ester cyclase